MRSIRNVLGNGSERLQATAKVLPAFGAARIGLLLVLLGLRVARREFLVATSISLALREFRLFGILAHIIMDRGTASGIMGIRIMMIFEGGK
jgi:hypothetical protein